MKRRTTVAEAIEDFREFSLIEISAVLAGRADVSAIDEYELLRRASLDLLDLPRGRPPVCDDSRSLGEMSRLMEQNEARSTNHAATLVAEKLTGEHSVTSARDRLAKKYRRLIAGQNTDLNLRRGLTETDIKTEADIKNPSEEES